jgi:hypothetical protein
MKKTAKYLAVAVMISSGAVALAQDAPGNTITVSGVNLSDLHLNGDLTVATAGLNLQVGAAVKDDLLAGTEKFAQGASKVTEINLNPSTMGMVGRTYGSEGEMTKKMKLMVVHTYSYDKPGLFRMDDVDTYVKKLEDGSWSCPIVSREKEGNQEKLNYICTKSDPDQTNEMVVLTAEPQHLTFIHMAGTMSLSDLTRMSDSAHGLSRSVEPHGNQFIEPQIMIQQQRLQDLHRAFSTPPNGSTPSTPPLPATPPTQ